jgi:streptogramin lyase
MKQFAQSHRLNGIFAGRGCRSLSFVAAAGGLFASSIGTLMAQAQTRTFPIRNGAAPFDITQASDGNFWFTLSSSSKVARITPQGQISYRRTPSLSNPAFITVGPDGNV